MSKPRSAKRAGNRRLGQVAIAAKADVEGKVVDMLKAKGGKLDDATVRGIARLIGGKKSTVHNAIGSLLASGVVAKVRTGLVLMAA